jgi:alkylhydroperoxidase family enzyme
MAGVPLLTSAEASGKAAEVMASIEETGRVLPILRAVANAQTAFPHFVRYSASLVYRLSLPARLRELVIMRAAAHVRSRYEWGEHYDFALGAGVTEEELRALAAGVVPATLTSDELLSGTTHGREELVEKLTGHLGHQQYTELALVVGWWCGCVPAMIDMLGLEADAPTVTVAL